MRLVGLGTMLLLAACSSSTGPEQVLTGTYVGDRIGLLATARSAEVSVPCMVITLAGPLGMQSDGTLDGAGKVTGSPKGLFEGRSVRVSGAQVDGSVSLTVEWFVDGNWNTLGMGTMAPVASGTDHRVPATCIQ